LAGTILHFPVRGAANAGPPAPRQAHRACAVLRLDGGGRSGHPLGRDVDWLLVELLRDTIARGEYRVDARRVARKMIAHGF